VRPARPPAGTRVGCALEACGRRRFSNGLCSVHFMRCRRHGALPRRGKDGAYALIPLAGAPAWLVAPLGARVGVMCKDRSASPSPTSMRGPEPTAGGAARGRRAAPDKRPDRPGHSTAPAAPGGGAAPPPAFPAEDGGFLTAAWVALEPRLREILLDAFAAGIRHGSAGAPPAPPRTTCEHGPQLVRLRELEGQTPLDQRVLDGIRDLFAARGTGTLTEALDHLERAAAAAGLFRRHDGPPGAQGAPAAGPRVASGNRGKRAARENG
jgi:hypothetical protein